MTGVQTCALPISTPGESVDIVVTDYGVAVNPRRPDLLEALKAADCVPLKTIEELRDIAYSIVCLLYTSQARLGYV